MRKLALAIATALLITTPALAGTSEGRITAIDPAAMTVTLSDGNSYKLPDEFDLAALAEGMTVLLAYDEIEGVKLVTDMVVSE
jgi:hypothetical protein